MKNRRILMAVTNDLVTDQRVHRSCTALQEAGYEVVLIGRLLPDSLPIKRTYRTIRMNLFFRRSAAFYAEFNIRLLFKMLFMKADIIYANDTDTLLGCYWVSRIKRKPLMMDAHELFCEVPELVGRERVKRFWRRIEDKVIPRLSGACTVCEPISQIYNHQYGVDFSVVRNVPMGEKLEMIPRDGSKMLLYQGAVNVGRGVDWMIEAMEYLPEYRLVVAGNGDELDDMKALASSKPWKDRITFVGRLAPEELKKMTQQAHIGLVLLADLGKNYYYSLPNRISDFVHVGVPVLATDFPEIRKVVSHYGIGSLIEGHDPETIAQKVREMSRQWDDVDETGRQEIFSKAADELNWDSEKRHLIEVVDSLEQWPSRFSGGSRR